MYNDLIFTNYEYFSDFSGFITFISNFVSNILAVIIGILITLWIERCRKSREVIRNQYEFVKLIKTEIKKNIELLNQMINVEFKKGSFPAYHLQTFTKESIWHTLINNHTFDNALLENIGRSYYEYDLINRLLNLALFSSAGANIIDNNIIPLVKTEIERSNKLLCNICEWQNKKDANTFT